MVDDPSPLPALILCAGSENVRVGSGADLAYRQEYPCWIGEPKAALTALSVPVTAGGGRSLKPLPGRAAAVAAPLLPMYACGDVQPVINLVNITRPVRSGLVERWVRLPWRRCPLRQCSHPPCVRCKRDPLAVILTRRASSTLALPPTRDPAQAPLMGTACVRGRPCPLSPQDAMEAVWKHALHATAVRTEQSLADTIARPLMLTEACFNTDESRQRLFETAFEGLGCTRLHLAHQSVLPLYALGRCTGVVMDCGHDAGFPVPVHEGFPMEFAVPDMLYNVAGRHISASMEKMFSERQVKVRGRGPTKGRGAALMWPVWDPPPCTHPTHRPGSQLAPGNPLVRQLKGHRRGSLPQLGVDPACAAPVPRSWTRRWARQPWPPLSTPWAFCPPTMKTTKGR